MSKSGDHICEICGEWADGKTYRIIEGIKMIVCNSCRNLGEPLRYSSTRSSRQSSSSNFTRSKSQSGPRKPQYSIKPKSPPRNFKPRTPKIEDLELIPEYRKILKKKRQNLNMSLSEFAQKIGITEASYRSIEAGKTDILMKDAIKTEKLFKIKITERILEEDDLDLSTMMKKPGNYTLGDVIIKKRGK
jgi:uncharacterized protein (TIGR00270 family)